MLGRAFNHKEALTRCVLKSIDDPFFDYLWSNYTDFDLDIKESNYYKQQWVSVSPTMNVTGYFEASVDRAANSVDSLVIANFEKDKNAIFSLDLKEFVLRLFLRYNYIKINFSVVVGSRNEKIYDRFVTKYGGVVIGIFKKHRIQQDGTLKDMKYYEIMREDFEKAARRLHPKQVSRYLNEENEENEDGGIKQ